MGCGASKLEPGEEPPPPGIRPIRHKIEEIKRRRTRTRTRKDSIVSTTELLKPEDPDIIDDGRSSGSSLDKATCRLPPLTELDDQVKKEGDDNDKDPDNRGRMLMRDADQDDEELPGSPSFRVYFVDDSIKDDSSKDDEDSLAALCEKNTSEEKEGTDNSNPEECESKPAKKVRGRGLRALAKRPSSYGFFNVRSRCINHAHSNSMSRDEHSPLSGKTSQ